MRSINSHKQDRRVHRLPSQVVCARKAETPLRARNKPSFEGLVLLAISNPCARRMLPPLPGTRRNEWLGRFVLCSSNAKPSPPPKALELEPYGTVSSVGLVLGRGIIFIAPPLFTSSYASSPPLSTPLS